MKKCSKCGKKKPTSSFYKRKEADAVYSRPHWKECCKAAQRREHLSQEDREKYLNDKRNKRLLDSFGITIEQYNSLLVKQMGVCAICKKPETFRRSSELDTWRLAVDHDHITGKVRGLLCHLCNLALGNMREDEVSLLSMVAYLREHKTATN